MAGDVTAVVDPVAALYADETTQLTASTKFLIVRTKRRELAIMVDSVDGVASHGDSGNRSKQLLPTNLPMLKEMIADTDGLIYIADPEVLLSAAEEARLDVAIVEFANG